jgi:hypothetical protein
LAGCSAKKIPSRVRVESADSPNSPCSPCGVRMDSVRNTRGTVKTSPRAQTMRVYASFWPVPHPRTPHLALMSVFGPLVVFLSFSVASRHQGIGLVLVPVPILFALVVVLLLSASHCHCCRCRCPPSPLLSGGVYSAGLWFIWWWGVSWGGWRRG